MLLTLGPKICTCDLLWAVGSPQDRPSGAGRFVVRFWFANAGSSGFLQYANLGYRAAVKEVKVIIIPKPYYLLHIHIVVT